LAQRSLKDLEAPRRTKTLWRGRIRKKAQMGGFQRILWFPEGASTPGSMV
jgi:hypothetical protein